MFNPSEPVLKKIELPDAVGLSAGAIATALRLRFLVEPADRDDDELGETAHLIVNPPWKAPFLSR